MIATRHSPHASFDACRANTFCIVEKFGRAERTFERREERAALLLNLLTLLVRWRLGHGLVAVDVLGLAVCWLVLLLLVWLLLHHGLSAVRIAIGLLLLLREAAAVVTLARWHIP